MPVLLILISTYYSTKYLVIQVENYLLKLAKKVDFENSKVPNCNFSTKSMFNQCGFSNSAVCWGPKNHTIRRIPVVAIQKNIGAQSTHLHVLLFCKEFFVMHHNIGHSNSHAFRSRILWHSFWFMIHKIRDDIIKARQKVGLVETRYTYVALEFDDEIQKLSQIKVGDIL